MKHVCPDGGGIYANKGYCDKHAKQAGGEKAMSFTGD